MNLNIATTINDIEYQPILSAVQDIKCSIEELHTLSARIDTTTSNEGLKEIFGAISATYRTTHMKLLNLFKLSRIKYKTEFADWSKDNAGLITEVEQLDFDKIAETEVDFPTGMKFTYLEALDLISTFFNEFETSAQIPLVLSTVDTVLNSVSKDADTHEAVVTTSDKSLTMSSKNIISTANIIKNGFDINRAAGVKKPFNKLFEIDPFVGNVDSISDQVSNIEESLDLCVKYILDKSENEIEGYVPSKDFLRTFSNFIKQIDTMFSLYGDITIRTLAIQHNLTFVYTTLDKQK